MHQDATDRVLSLESFTSLERMRRDLEGATTALSHKFSDKVREYLAPIYRAGVVRVFGWDLSAPGPADPLPPSGFEFREVAVGELDASAAEFQIEPGEIHRRLRMGDRCFGALVAGRPVHVRWIATRPVEVPELDAFACPGPAEVYAYAAHTLGPYRAQRASTATRQVMEVALLAEGYRRACAYILAENSASLASMRAHHRLNYEVGFHRVLGRTLTSGTLRPPLYRLRDLPAPPPGVDGRRPRIGQAPRLPSQGRALF